MQKVTVELLPHEATEEAVNAIVELNKTYPDELALDREEVTEILLEPTTINYVLRLDNKIIGCCLYADIRGYSDNDFLNETTDKVEWSPNEFAEKHGDKILYAEDTTILPEYRGKGFAKFLKEKTYNKLKNDWNFIIGHANSGAMINISKELGGEIIQEFVNWFDSGETHVLYQIDLKKPRTGTIVYGKHEQETDYSCGLASMRNLLFNVGILVTEQELMGLKYCTEDKGISPCDIVKILSAYEVPAVLGTLFTAEGIISILEQNKPCLVNYQSSDDGHWSLIYDKVDNYFLIFDCDGGKKVKYNMGEFEKVFYSNRYGKGNCIYLYT